MVRDSYMQDRVSAEPPRIDGSRSAQGRIEWRTGEDGLQRGQQRLALLAQGRQIAAQACEGVRARVAAEAARHLLVQLEGPQIALGLVVVEGDGQVREEGEHLVLAQPQALQEIARGRLLDASALAGAPPPGRDGGAAP